MGSIPLLAWNDLSRVTGSDMGLVYWESYYLLGSCFLPRSLLSCMPMRVDSALYCDWRHRFAVLLLYTSHNRLLAFRINSFRAVNIGF